MPLNRSPLMNNFCFMPGPMPMPMPMNQSFPYGFFYESNDVCNRKE